MLGDWNLSCLFESLFCTIILIVNIFFKFVFEYIMDKVKEEYMKKHIQLV